MHIKNTDENIYKITNTIINNSIDAITIQDLEGNIKLWNKGAQLIYGWDEDEATKMNIKDIVPDKYRAEALNLIKQIKEGLPVPSLETKRITKDGRQINVWLTITKLTDHKGQITSIATTERDITSKIFENETIFNKYEELKTLIFSTAHDLKSPLINIEGFCKEISYSIDEIKETINSIEIQKSNKDKILNILNSDINESLDTINKSKLKMDTLLKGLLKITRLEQIIPIRILINMNNLLDNISNQMKFQLKESKATIKIEKLPKCLGDIDQINQVFSNLIDNAIKYKSSERHLTINISGKSIDNKSIYFIKDNGIGIASSMVKNIFDIFYRIDPKSNVAGSGIGLSIVKKLVLQNGGNINVESDEGKGSCFIIELPSP